MENGREGERMMRNREKVGKRVRERERKKERGGGEKRTVWSVEDEPLLQQDINRLHDQMRKIDIKILIFCSTLVTNSPYRTCSAVETHSPTLEG